MATTQALPAKQALLEWPFVGKAAGRDLVWRARRWAIATAGTSVAFSVSLLLAGFLASFSGEVTTTLRAIGGDGYVVQAGSAGPFTTPAPIDEGLAEQLRADPGVTSVSPLVTIQYPLHRPGHAGVHDAFVVGRDADGPGRWPIKAGGRAPTAPGEVVVDGRSGAKVDEVIELAGDPYTVVGVTSGVHVFAGKSAIWMTVQDAQDLLFEGLPVVSGFVVDGVPEQLPPGTAFVDRADGRKDLLRLVKPIIESITTFRLLMWLVASAIVGSVLYLTALDRVRDFAVFKATGSRDRELVASLLLQSALLALVASSIAMVIAYILAPTFPTPVLFTRTLLLTAPVIALVIGAIGSLAGVRRAMTTDPALAFGGA